MSLTLGSESGGLSSNGLFACGYGAIGMSRSVLDGFNDPLCTGVELQESFDVRLFIQTSLL